MHCLALKDHGRGRTLKGLRGRCISSAHPAPLVAVISGTRLRVSILIEAYGDNHYHALPTPIYTLTLLNKTRAAHQNVRA